MTNPLRRAGSVLATTALALTLAGCGTDAPGPGDPGGSPSGAPGSTGSDPGQDASAAQEARSHEPVDPCTLLSESERADLIGQQEIAYVGKGLAPADTFLMECTLIEPEESLALLRFGYASTPDLDYTDDVAYDVEQGARLSELPDVGDRALVVRDDYQLDAWASLGPYTVFFGSSWHDTDDATASALLASMLAKVVPGMLEHPVLLPEGCPAATSPRVVASVGKVQRAIGSADDRHLQCQYASKRKLLELGAYPSTREHVELKSGDDDPYAGLASEDRETLSYRPGSLTRLTPADTGPSSFTYLKRPPQVITSSLGEASHLDELSSFPRYDIAAYRALDRWWATTQIKRLQR